MTLTVGQYLAPLNSQQVLNGYVQGVKQGTGLSIAADGTITLDTTGAATLGFLTSSTTPAPVYNWPTGAANSQSILSNDSLGNLTWTNNYVPTVPAGGGFPQSGASVLPVGGSAARPAAQPGLLRYNSDLFRMEFNNGTSWFPVSPASGGVFSFTGTTTPTANAAGDLWLDTNTNQAKVWNGTVWVPTTPLASATVPGRVIAGTNIQLAPDGTISVLPTTGVSGSVSNLGLTTITDNTTSLSVDSALSANQGRLLQDQINALLISSNLTFAGIIAGTGLLTYVTPEGTLQGFTAGSPLPSASVTNAEYFVIVESAGGFTPPGSGFTVVTQGDWFVSTGTSWQFLNVGYDPPYATTAVPGIIELATDAETQSGTDTTRAITPSNLSSRTATETRTGIAELATQAETNAGTDDVTIVTPLKLHTAFSSGSIDATDVLLSPALNGNTTVQAALNDAVYDITSPLTTLSVGENPTGQFTLDVVQATESQLGGAEVATDAETQALTSNSLIVTPLKLGNLFSSGILNANGILLNPTINGNLNVQDALADAIYDVASSDSSVTVVETAVGQVDLTVTQATESQIGGAQVATQVETNAGTDDSVFITPAKLAGRAATETLTGLAEIATQVEADAGTDDTKFITPKKLFGVLTSGAIDATDILLNPTINGNTNVQSALADAVYNVASANTSITVTQTAVGQVDIIVTQATETLIGGAEIATQAETNAAAASASDTVIVTPKKLANRTATEAQTGIAELATQVETQTGTDDERIVTPLKLRTAAVYKSDFDAKGDLLSATADNTPQRLGVGTNGQVLTADSTTATGLTWATPGAPAFYNLDDISGGFNGTAVTFNLAIGGVAYAPTPISNIMVFLGGVAQIPGAGNAYTIAGSTITFNSAPPVGATFLATTVR